MYKDILVPIVFDHDPSDQQALAVAHNLAKAGGKVTLLHIVEELPGFITVQLPEEIYKDTIAEAKSKLQALAKTLPIPIDVMVETGHASRRILQCAEQLKADCIVISSHKPGLSDYFLGSTAAQVVRHATCTVHVLR